MARGVAYVQIENVPQLLQEEVFQRHDELYNLQEKDVNAMFAQPFLN